MKQDLHPSFYDIVPSVASAVLRRFRGWVSREDLTQECWLWAVAKNNAFLDMLNEEIDYVQEMEYKTQEHQI